MYAIEIENRCFRELKQLDKTALRRAFNEVNFRKTAHPVRDSAYNKILTFFEKNVVLVNT